MFKRTANASSANRDPASGSKAGTRRALFPAALLGFVLAFALAGGAAGAPGDVTVTQVADIEPGPGNGSSPTNLFSAGGILFFAATTSADGAELWKSNGGPLGPGGTEMLEDDGDPGGIADGSGDSNPSDFASIGQTVFFAAQDAFSPTSHGKELWKIDPPYATPVEVKNINPTGGAGSFPHDLVNVNGTLFFSAESTSGDEELWKSVPPYDDGSTSRVEDINSGLNGSFPDQLTNVNGTLFFQADDGSRGTELWKSTDGTAAGTDIVKNIAPDPDGGFPDQLVNVNGTLFFAADDGTNGTELWKSGGTEATTSMVENINVTPDVSASSEPSELLDMNGTLFFRANDGAAGDELWKSPPPHDAAATDIAADIHPGSGGSGPAELTRSGAGTFYFRASDGVNGTELWRSTGGPVGPGGTELVADINPGTIASTPADLEDVNGTLFFRANDSLDPVPHGRELWTTAGGGATRVTDLNPMAADSTPQDLTEVDGVLFFVAEDGATGLELWKATIEGSAPVTTPVPVVPLAPAPAVDDPQCDALRKKLKKAKTKKKRKKLRKKLRKLGC